MSIINSAGGYTAHFDLPPVRREKPSAHSTEVAVMGAGLTGVTAALCLARAGVSVTLIEQDERTMNRASLRNEGKIHLGFVFSQDLSAASSNLQLSGALRFRSILERLIGERANQLQLSHPFVYLVPEDSIASPDELEARFERLDETYRWLIAADAGIDYFGQRPESLSQRIPLPSLNVHIRPDRFIGAFATEEVAIDTQELSDVLQAAVLAEPRITFRPLHTVQSVERVNGRFLITGTTTEGTWKIEAGQVINGLWENRFKIDRTVGLEHAPGWLHRLKYRVIAKLPENMRNGPSTTLVVGPYGDVVIRPDATAYFSWYPLGLRGWSEELAPPESWNAACRGELDADERSAVSGALLSAIDEWYPGAANATPLIVDAGAIVAYGRTDVGDINSGLHDRTHVGVTEADGYFSVDPGKMTTAPLFGVQAAFAVLAQRTRA
jgi:threonine dehydrogenase-like Zn-dependent dehydrogenase